MTARRQIVDLDDDGASEESNTTADAWKLVVTETDEIDEIAERDAKRISEKVRRALSSEAAGAGYPACAGIFKLNNA